MSGALSRAGRALVEEAVFHQHLLAAESGELAPLPEEFQVRKVVAEVAERTSLLPARVTRRLVVRCPGDLSVRTDRLLFARSVRIVLKAAVETSPGGETVTVEATRDGEDGAAVRIRHPGVLRPGARERMLKPATSTGAAGGAGGAPDGETSVHAARAFVEGYLGGRIGIKSTSASGTVFSVVVPSLAPEGA
jgi:signal transduction histidine kinase